MAITDLTGTTWKFNNTVDMAGYYYLLDYYEGYLWIDFTTAGGISCAAMDGSSSTILYRSSTVYTVYTTANGWVSPDYQTITITGGAQAKGSLFINWFTVNATQIKDDYFTCTDELTSIADAIRTKGSTSASLTYPSGFVTAINNLPTKVLGAGTISGYDSPFDIQVTADDYSAGEWDGFSSVSINISTPFYDGSCDIINPPIDALIFTSPTQFTLATNSGAKNWDGQLEYSTNNVNWTVWDGTSAISAQLNRDLEYCVYVRGTGNSYITSSSSTAGAKSWVLNGSNVRCEGNIEYLLDYASVINGSHPQMANYCYAQLFYNCTALTAAPSLLSPSTVRYCYFAMFSGCTSLTEPPSLPASNIAVSAYQSMFYGCTSLNKIPAIYATSISDYAAQAMFSNCSNIKMSTSSSSIYKNAWRIPISGTGTAGRLPFDNMFNKTGGSKITPSVNTTYYTSNDIVYQ